jgi:hypothetical protein
MCNIDKMGCKDEDWIVIDSLSQAVKLDQELAVLK